MANTISNFNLMFFMRIEQNMYGILQFYKVFLKTIDIIGQSCYISVPSTTARRNPCVIPFLSVLICIDAIRNGRAASLFWFYPVTGKFSFLVSSTSYKPFDSKSFILCEQFHIWLARFRDSAADRWFSLFLKTCHLAFPHMTYRMFSCHC